MVVPFFAGENDLFCSIRQYLFGIFDVFADLGRELGRAGELTLAAEVTEQIDLDRFAVDILVEVEDVGLRHQLVAAEGRVVADIEYSAVAFAVVDHLGDIDTVLGAEILGGDGKVGSGESHQRPAALFAPFYFAADLVVAAEQALLHNASCRR